MINNAAACYAETDERTKKVVRTVLHKWLHRFSAQRCSAYWERNADAPPGRSLGDLYRLGGKVGKVMKEALIFCHSVTEKAP